jgi:polysaccharide export outer membrane protein
VEKEIRNRYVPRLYKYMTVTINWRDATQFYYVDGEVKSPARQTYIERTTVLKAIASAGGFTDFAKKAGVTLTRQDGRKFIINCKKARVDSKLDLEVYPGDKVYVPRKIW